MFDEQTIDVWIFKIEVENAITSLLESFLSASEQYRANAFRFSHLRRSYITSRGTLRVLLGHYLRLSPKDVQIEYGTLGKPYVTSPEGLRFNVSHSGSLAVVAFAIRCEIGIDIERIRHVDESELIATRLFHSDETAELRTVPVSQKEQAFFLCWTRKESYVKAFGQGLSVPLNSFCVTLTPGKPARFISLCDQVWCWTLHNLELAPDYAAALAYRAKSRRIREFVLVHSALGGISLKAQLRNS